MTYSASSKLRFALFISLILGSSPLAKADSSIVAVAAGRDSSEAIMGVLKNIVPKSIHVEPTFLRGVLGNEILPFATHFVTSYKILEGGSGSYVSVEANVDLPVIQSLYSFTPKNIGLKEEDAKVLFVFSSPRLATLESLQATNYFAAVTNTVKDFLQRRKFSVVEKKESASAMSGEDPFSADVLKSMGKSQGAPLILGISVAVETEENENNHTDEDHIVLRGSLVDSSTGNVLAKLNSYFLFPKVRKDQVLADFQKLLSDTSKEFMLNLMIQAGQHFLGTEQKDSLTLEVKYPPSEAVITKFRKLLEGSRDIKSIVELKVERGSYVFALQSSLDRKGLIKKILSLKQDEFVVVLDEKADSGTGPISIQLKNQSPTAKATTLEMEDKQVHETH